MDKQQAQFILHSFRPDGADAADPDFAEALLMAAEDRSLGEWLASERSSDAAFAEALGEITIPSELRNHILSVMRGETPQDEFSEQAEIDTLMSESLSRIEAPAELRDQILASMQVQSQLAPAEADTPAEPSAPTSRESNPVTVVHPSSRPAATSPWWLRVGSLAAAVVLGGLLASQIDLRPAPNQTLVSNKRVTAYDVQSEAARMLNSKFVLDVMNPQQSQVNNWLSSQQLPAPSKLPNGLQGMKVMGCKKIQLAGNRTASLLCFVKSSGDKVHLVIINNDHIEDAHLPGMDEVSKGDCYHCPKTGWNMTRWRDRENTFLLFAKKETTSQDELIQYF